MHNARTNEHGGIFLYSRELVEIRFSFFRFLHFSLFALWKLLHRNKTIRLDDRRRMPAPSIKGWSIPLPTLIELMVVCTCEWQRLSRAKEKKETGEKKKEKKEKKNCGQFPRTFLWFGQWPCNLSALTICAFYHCRYHRSLPTITIDDF